MELLTPKEYKTRHVTEISITGQFGGFHYFLIEERKDTYQFLQPYVPAGTTTVPPANMLLIQTHYDNGEVNEDVVIYLDRIVAYSIRRYTQKYEVKPEPKKPEAAHEG